MRIVPQQDAQIEDLLQEYAAARKARDSAQLRLDEAQQRLTKQMEADQRKQAEFVHNGFVYRATYVKKNTTQIDEPGLRKALSAKVFDAYTTKKLDRRAMEKAMDEGKVDPMVVSKFVTMVPSKPYLSYTQVAKEDEDG